MQVSEKVLIPFFVIGVAVTVVAFVGGVVGVAWIVATVLRG